MRYASDRTAPWLLLPALCVACGGSPAVSEPAAPSEPPPPAAVASTSASAPAPATSAPVAADEPPFPPAPWVIAASAPSERSFVRHELEGATLWAACYGAWGVCVQPELAIERADRLEATTALAADMPELRYVDLRLEPDGHWRTIHHKADTPMCPNLTYVGPRGMTGLYGRFPDDVWMTVDRSGEEPVMTSVTSVFRFQGERWKHVRTQPKSGDRVVQLLRWRSGMLGLVERLGMPVRFEAFGTGGAVPRVGNARLDQVVVRGQTLLATTRDDLITLVGWAPGGVQPVAISLRASLASGRDEIGKLVFTPGGDVEISGFGEIPIEAKLQDEFRNDKLRAKLRFTGGRWRVVEQKLDDWKSEAALPESPALSALGADARVSIVSTFVASDGSHWVHARSEERELLLRDRPVQAVWRVSDAERLEVPPRYDPSCRRSIP